MSKKIAYTGILLSLNAILLILVNIVSINTLFLLGLASFPIAIVIIEFGPKNGITFYLASIILGFLIMNSKIHWLLYVMTFGIYGLIKYIIEKDRPVFVEYLLKILFANFSFMILYFVVKQFIYIPMNLIFIGMFNIAFIIYDYMYSRFIEYYYEKIRNVIKIKNDMLK